MTKWLGWLDRVAAWYVGLLQVSTSAILCYMTVGNSHRAELHVDAMINFIHQEVVEMNKKNNKQLK